MDKRTKRVLDQEWRQNIIIRQATVEQLEIKKKEIERLMLTREIAIPD
jgi:hypothetical protein